MDCYQALSHSAQLLREIAPTSNAVWGLIGVLLGGWLANRNNQLHWHKDNRRREYKELIKGLLERVSVIRNTRTSKDKQELDRLNTAVNTGFDLIRTRIFIQERNLKRIESRWISVQRCAQWDADDVQVSPDKPLIPYTQNKMFELGREVETELVNLCRKDMKSWR